MAQTDHDLVARLDGLTRHNEMLRLREFELDSLIADLRTMNERFMAANDALREENNKLAEEINRLRKLADGN